MRGLPVEPPMQIRSPAYNPTYKCNAVGWGGGIARRKGVEVAKSEDMRGLPVELKRAVAHQIT